MKLFCCTNQKRERGRENFEYRSKNNLKIFDSLSQGTTHVVGYAPSQYIANVSAVCLLFRGFLSNTVYKDYQSVRRNSQKSFRL
jgi:hypothetical protein